MSTHTEPSDPSHLPVSETTEPPVRPSPEEARRILHSLMFSSSMMPMVSSMSRVALPMIRDDFQMQADLTSWVAAAFYLPFMVLMPLYGRLSDLIPKRTLILLGIGIFSVGAMTILTATDIVGLMMGQAIQGVGLAGMMPMAMALISTVFGERERGRALGTWAAIGPFASFMAPLMAGLLIAAYGWRAGFAPPLGLAMVAFFVIRWGVPGVIPRGPEAQDSPPSVSDRGRPSSLRSFDWGGVLLLSGALTSTTFFLSSRFITGAEPFTDWRLLVLAAGLMSAFVWRERRIRNPYVSLELLTYPMFRKATYCATVRMFVMGGLGFLIPLYLVDTYDLTPTELGGMLIISSGSMTLIVRFGGLMADRFSSRRFVLIGLAAQCATMLNFWRMADTAGVWMVGATLSFYGLGAGLMLAALHRTAMGEIQGSQMGAAAGLYSMFRFLGSVTGTAICGVVLQHFFDAGLPTVEAYQNTFLMLAAVPVTGALVAAGLKERMTIDK